MLTGPVPPLLFVTHSGFLVCVRVEDLTGHTARLSQIASLQVALWCKCCKRRGHRRTRLHKDPPGGFKKASGAGAYHRRFGR